MFFCKLCLDHNTVIECKSCISTHDNSFPETRPGQVNYTIKKGWVRSSWQIGDTKGVDGVDKSCSEKLPIDIHRGLTHSIHTTTTAVCQLNYYIFFKVNATIMKQITFSNTVQLFRCAVFEK